MFYVTSLDGLNVEPLIRIGDDFRMEESVDGTLTASFTCFPSEKNPGYDILGSETVVTIAGYDFKVKQFSNSGYSKRVDCISTFFEHSKTQVDGIFEGSHTLRNHLNHILSTSGWTYTIDSDIENVTNFIKDLGNSNIIALLNKVLKYHQIEYIILPDNKLYFAKQVGGEYEHQYRYNQNVGDVVLLEDSTNLHTYIRGYGKDGLFAEYVSPNESKFGRKQPDPVRDDRFTDVTSLTNYIKNSITDVPELAIESSIPEMTERETGERVWLIYGPLNLIMETRILKQVKVLRDNKLVTESVVFGNTLIKTSTDLLLEQQEQINDNKDYVEEVKENIQEDINIKFTETEERIISQGNTITSEYTAAITANAQVIRTEMGQKESNINNTIGAQYTKITSEYNSAITQTAQSIRQDVNASITAVNGNILEVNNYASRIEQSANQIQQTVSSQQATINSQGTAISNAQSAITQNANAIVQKVSTSDYNGQTIASKISQTAYDYSIQASKINFTGHVFGEGSTWSGDIRTNKNIFIGSGIRFSDFTEITSYSGGMDILAYNELTVSATRTTFWGPVTFTGAVSGLNNINAASLNGMTFTPITGGLTVRQNGTYLGQLKYS